MKKAIYWLKDYSYLFQGKVMAFFYRKPPAQYLGYVIDGKCPVVVIPGISIRWAFMKPLADAISSEGHPVYILPDLKRNLFPIAFSAEIVRSFIDEKGLDNVVVVAHSKGGLIGKYLLGHFNKDGKIKGMVAIATPFSGSSLARIIPHKSYDELLPESEIIGELKIDRGSNKRIISIMPEYDNHVWHKETSMIEGAFENIVLPIKGHHKIVFDKETKRVVLESINKLSA